MSLPVISALADDPRAPSLRTLVRMAGKAKTAEQFGALLAERYARNEAGMPHDSSDDALDQQFDRLKQRLLGRRDDALEPIRPKDVLRWCRGAWHC